jgi:hypothetical protein
MLYFYHWFNPMADNRATEEAAEIYYLGCWGSNSYNRCMPRGNETFQWPWLKFQKSMFLLPHNSILHTSFSLCFHHFLLSHQHCNLAGYRLTAIVFSPDFGLTVTLTIGKQNLRLRNRIQWIKFKHDKKNSSPPTQSQITTYSMLK